MNRRRADESRPDATNRRLVWVPIIHTREDMGRLQQKVEAEYIRRLGRARWNAHRKSVGTLWEDIRRWIDGLGLDFDHVRLYQDGLPVCGHEERIVRELASQASLNHRLLADLIDRGARLTGTESPQLLLEEYELNRRILGVAPGAAAPAGDLSDEARRLLESRDQFIASRIAETLQPGECGLVFLGMLHSLEGRLPADIHLTILRPGDPKGSVPRRPR
jgi:hypothetical protein